MIPDSLALNLPEISLMVGVMFLSSLAGALVGYRVGQMKARPMLGVILGGLLTVPGLLAIWLMPQKEPAYY